SQHLDSGAGDLDTQRVDLGCFTDRPDGVLDQLLTLDLDAVGGLLADRLPELLELRSGVELLVEHAWLTLADGLDVLADVGALDQLDDDRLSPGEVDGQAEVEADLVRLELRGN